MRTLIIAFALMFSAITFGQMTFSVNDLDVRRPMDSQANIGWFMTDDIMLSMGMSDWDNFNVSARVYTDFFDRAFIQATTTASMTVANEREYMVGAALGWTKALGIWRLQFEPMIVLDDIQDFTPRLAWGLRFNL